MEVTWGEVVQVSPTVEVRIAGDAIDRPVGLKADGLTLATNDKVALLRLGSTGGWMIVAKVVASA